MVVRKVPMRMCTVCRERKPKRDLIRVVKTPGNAIKLDITGKLNGRGAYICKSRECFAKAAKMNTLSRALETNVTQEIYDQLETELKDIE